ncbi:MAG: alpha/beta fold hydrolase [Acidobacteria bacterium]|nr:alpha/beta fold hydrolase [Acidobacteriota bacterium]MDA1233502.1 alpha/beta fold hydrolase [Acidobacteriota bacterium]
MARILESVFIDGPAGKLEALHEGPEDGVAIERVAVVCHPHPLHGGTIHNKVVFRLARGIRNTGSAVIRFNFRGAGLSEGTHDDGRGEQDDVRAAVAFARERYPDLPVIGSGFSFGSNIGLRVAAKDGGFERFIAAGLPANRGGFEFLAKCEVPKIFIHSTNDEHGSRENMQKVFDAAAEPKLLEWVDASDHFFVDRLEQFEQKVIAAVLHDFIPE